MTVPFCGWAGKVDEFPAEFKDLGAEMGTDRGERGLRLGFRMVAGAIPDWGQTAGVRSLPSLPLSQCIRQTIAHGNR